MDHTGKLPGGIIGVTICLILLLAAAFPIMGAMIDLVPRETTGPGQVTESGTNDASEPYYAYIPAPTGSHSYAWSFTYSQNAVRTLYYEDEHLKGQGGPIPTYTAIVSGSTAADSGMVYFDGTDLYVDSGTQSLVYSDLSGFDMSLVYDNTERQIVLRVGISQYYDGGVRFTHFTYVGVGYIFVQTVEGMTATHGYVSGSPEAIMGDTAAEGSAFKTDATAGGDDIGRIAIDMSPAAATDQRVFLLDNGMVLDLDDKENPVKAISRSESERIAGPVLKTSRALTVTTIRVDSTGATDVFAVQDVSSEYVATWGEYQAPRDLEVPMLETVSLAGSPVAGWFIPMEWEHTGTGTVTVKTMIYTVLSVIPLILVVALFILVVRWMQAESGVKETDALLGGGRPKYDGWRDRR